MLSPSGFPFPSASVPVLTTQPLFLPFLFLPVSASQWLPQCSLSALASWVSLILSSLISHASFLILRTQLSVRFLSSLPVSLPQLFLRCFPFAFAFGLSLSVRFRSGSDYSASVSSFPLSSCLCLTVASSVLPFCSRFLGFPHSLQPDLSCFLPDSSYSAFCSFPFVPPGLAPTAVPPVLPFCLRLRAFSLSFCFLSSASVPVLTTQLSVSSFPLSSLPRLSAAFQVLPLCLSTSLLFPVLSDLVSYVFFPGSSYSAFCLFPFILP